MLCDANGIDYVVTFFRLGIRGDFFQLIIVYTPACSSFHLRIKYFGVDIAHKQYHFKWSDVGACGDKRHRYSNPEILFNAEVPYKSIGITCRISDFSHIVFGNLSVIELFPKHFLRYLNNFIGMVIILREYERLGNICPIPFAII